MKKKRILSVLLTLCMALGTLPMTAFAEDAPADSMVTTESAAPLDENKEGQLVTTEPTEPTAVDLLQNRINALPDEDRLMDMDEDEQAEVYAEICDIYDAIDALTDDEANSLDVSALEEAATFFTQQIVELEETQITADYSWYSAEGTEFTLMDAADLLGFANIANGTAWENIAANTFVGKTIKLGADIDLNGATWTPVGAETAKFAGTFDGQQHTIKNFVLGYTTDSEGYQYCGFFNWIDWPSGSVCNLTLRDITATIGEKGRFGTVACYVAGGDDKNYTNNMMHDVHVKNVTVTSTSADARVGGMFCRTSRSFKDCTVENLKVNVPNGIVTLGGFVSFVYANNQHFENCSVDGFTVNAANCNDEDGIGGFAGYFNNSYGWTNFFDKCTVSGLDITVSGTKSWVGGFVGCPCANIIATDCSAKGKINASGVTGGFVGGFMGNFGWKAATGAVYSLVHQLKNSTADVDIMSGGAPAGGFIGSASCSNDGSKYGVFENCTASGDVTNTNGAAGGFAGEAVSGRYTGCKATGKVEGKTSGGFIGEVKDYTPSYDKHNADTSKIGQANEIKVSECEASGTVIGSECAGGLIGNVGDKTSPNEDGSKGELIVTNSTVSATVVGTGSTTQVAGVMNSDDSEKIDNDATQNNSGGTTIVPPEGENITVKDDGSITIPAGSTVTENDESKELENGGQIGNDGAVKKYTGKLTLSAYSGSYRINKGPVTFTYTYDGYAPVSVNSSDDNIAEATIFGDTVTVELKSVGIAIITVSATAGNSRSEATYELTVLKKKSSSSSSDSGSSSVKPAEKPEEKPAEPDVKPEEKPATPTDPAEIPAAEKIVLTVGQRVANAFGELVVNDVAPIIRDDRTMLPIRFIAEGLGATVAWDGTLQKVTITKSDDVIDIYIGSVVAFVNGSPVELDSPAFIENGRTYLPLRFVAENLGATVFWNAETQEVTIVPNK